MKVSLNVQGVRVQHNNEPIVDVESLTVEAEYSTEEYTSLLASMVQLMNGLQNSSTYRIPTYTLDN